MTDAPTPLDLDAIVAAIAECRTYNFGMYQADRLAHEHAPALVEEVKRLRSESQRFYENRNLWQKRAEKAEAERDVARAEVARLTARPAPAWDEEAVAEAVRKDLEAAGILPWTNGGARIVRTALAVVRDHPLVKPGREDVARLIDPEAFSDWSGAHDPRAQVEQEARRGAALRSADKVLTLWPGRSEAEVKEEALREAKRAANHDWLAFQSVWGSSPSDLAVLAFANKALNWLHARADRLAAEGGADRG